MNITILIGRLARDPELSYTPNTQNAKCVFTIAVDRPRRNGEDQGADFIRITVWGTQGENCDRYLSKGRQVAVQGRIQTGSYKNRDGVTVHTTDVIADRVEFLGGNNQQAPTQTQETAPTQANESKALEHNESVGTQTSFDDLPDTFAAAEDDIPF